MLKEIKRANAKCFLVLGKILHKGDCIYGAAQEGLKGLLSGSR